MKKSKVLLICILVSLIMVGCDLENTPNRRARVFVTFYALVTDTLTIEYYNSLHLDSYNNLVDGASSKFASDIKWFSIVDSSEIISKKKSK